MPTRYDLDELTARRIIATTLAAHRGTGRYVCFVTGPDEPLADVARAVEREVFEDAFANDAGVLTAEYGPYESQSLFFVVLDRRHGAPAGSARVIEDDGPRVKTLEDAPEHIGLSVDEIVDAHGMRSGKVWDYATIAVRPAYRNLAVSSLLHRTFVVAGQRARAVHAVAMLDRVAWRNIRLLGVPVRQLAGSQPFAYLGSAENRAIYIEFDAIPANIARQAEALRKRRPIVGELPGRGWRRLLIRRIATRVATRVATGRDLDEHIVFA